MRSDRLRVRLMRLDWSQWLLIAEAALAVTSASLAIRLLPFARTIRLGSRRLATRPPVDCNPLFCEIRWSVMAVSARLPWKALCFQQGLALQWMLRRRGIDARLHYGIGRDPDGELAAHVWISAGEDIVIGGEQASAFRAVTAYP